MAVWFSNFQAAVSKLLGWPRATFYALLEIFKEINAVPRSTSGLRIGKDCKSRIQVKQTTLCCFKMWNLPPTQWMNSFVAFSQSPGFLIQVFPVLKTGANRLAIFTCGWRGELIIWGQYGLFEFVRGAEVLSGAELAVHANPNYFAGGFMCQTLYTSVVWNW